MKGFMRPKGIQCPRVIAILYGVALLTGAAMHTAALWDGGAQIALHIQNGVPWVPHSRWYLYPLNRVIIELAKIGLGSAAIVQLAGLIYSIFYIPFLVAIIGVKLNARLQYRAIAGAVVASFPIALFLGIEVIHSYWLLWAAAILLRGASYFQTALAVGCMLVGMISHPSSLLGLCIIAAFEGRNLIRAKNPRSILVASLALCLLIVRLLWNILAASSYESGEYAIGRIAAQFWHGALGLPLLLLSASIIEWFGARYAIQKDSARRICVVYCMSLIIGIVWYIGDLSQWNTEVEYRKWLPIFSSCFLLWFYLDIEHGDGVYSSEGFGFPLGVLQRWSCSAAIVCTVLMACRWNQIWARLREDMLASPTSIVRRSDLRWLADTPLRYWSGSATSLLVQGKQPKSVLLDEPIQYFADNRIWITPQIGIPTSGDLFIHENKNKMERR